MSAQIFYPASVQAGKLPVEGRDFLLQKFHKSDGYYSAAVYDDQIRVMAVPIASDMQAPRKQYLEGSIFSTVEDQARK